MTAIVDYGVGNLFSLVSSLKFINEKAIVTGSTEEIRSADRIILPGVGAFGDAMDKFKASELDTVVKEQAFTGKPLLGICLGMQMLFDSSCEYGEHEGLGLIHGKICPIAEAIPSDFKIPQIGWNGLEFTRHGRESKVFSDVAEGEFVYFVHSFYATECESNTVAYCDYGAKLTAAVQRNNIVGCQFHPEKSGETGLKILKAFCLMR